MVTETLAEKTYLGIRKDILTGQLKPGDQLVFRAIAERHGVSLAPVREAVSRLAAEGLITYIPGAGYFVKKLTKKDLYELYVLREGLESCAAHEAAINSHPVQLRELENLCQVFEDLAQQIPAEGASQEIRDKWIDAEVQFHELILEASRNDMLIQFCRNYRMQLQVFESQRRTPIHLDRKLAELTAGAHRQIYTAIVGREPEQARNSMIEHIRHGRDNTIDQFAQYF